MVESNGLHGDGDLRTKHAGCLVQVGSKWGKTNTNNQSHLHIHKIMMLHLLAFQCVTSGSMREVKSSEDLVD